MTPAIYLYSRFIASTDPTANVTCPDTISGTATANAATNNCNTGLPVVPLDSTSVQTITQIAFGIIGAVAVIIILIAGIRLIMSSGDPEAVNTARQTIIFAAIGLVIAVSAEILVTFVLTKL